MGLHRLVGVVQKDFLSNPCSGIMTLKNIEIPGKHRVGKIGVDGGNKPFLFHW
jgi:hypothetical protein